MWKQILDLLKKVIALTRATETNASDIAGLREELHVLRKDFRDLNNRLDTLSQIVQHLLHEMSKDRELAAKDRENLLLRLENTLLRHGHSLSRAESGETPSDSLLGDVGETPTLPEDRI